MNGRISHAQLMDRVYRHQRHFYDATRKYYLVGRDPMIRDLNVPANGTVLEIGCGTGRNLVHVGRQYPTVRLFGIDISAEMLRTASASIARAGMTERTRLAVADATTFDPPKVFQRASFDRIYISYAVSMITAWEAVIDAAVQRLAPGGELHIVDFGDLRDRPSWNRSALYTWLRWYHVTPRNDLFEITGAIAARHGCSAEAVPLYKGFAWIAKIRRPDRAMKAAEYADAA